MTIQLNQTIYYKELNFTHINATNTIISLITSDDRDQKPDFNLSSINFTWYVV